MSDVDAASAVTFDGAATGFVRVDEPPPRRPGGAKPGSSYTQDVWPARVALLASEPGQWFFYGGFSTTGNASASCRGALKRHDVWDEIELVTRNLSEGVAAAYLRWADVPFEEPEVLGADFFDYESDQGELA